MKNECFIGQVRPSQLLWTYGPGAFIDLPNISVVTMGLDFWKDTSENIIIEPRLLASVQRVAGAQVQKLVAPPIPQDGTVTPYSAEYFRGVPVRPFPRWLRCTKCNILAEYDTGLFELRQNTTRPEQTHFEHKSCQYKHAVAVPARFLVACANGHIDEFPWRWFVHGGPSDCQGSLHFYETGSSRLEDIHVECECGRQRKMQDAFSSFIPNILPACRGHHPHLNSFEPCTEKLRPVMLGSSNSWFPMTLSALSIPTEDSELAEIISSRWDVFQECESEKTAALLWKAIGRNLDHWPLAEIWDLIQRKKKQQVPAARISEEDVRVPEWKVLTSPNPPHDRRNFLCKETPPPDQFREFISEVRLLERLRRVNVLINFTRLEPPDELSYMNPKRQDRILLSKRPPEWLPASEVFGEGIFIRFNEEKLQEWETRPEVKARDHLIHECYKAWRGSRRLNPEIGYPGARYIILHSLSHLLVRELSKYCGYNTASIQERIYASTKTDPPMAWLLLYTAAPDSDGTLGGRVEMGEKKHLEEIILRTLENAQNCPSDPLCSKRRIEYGRFPNGAACHSCIFVPETTCEICNRFLDRSMVVAPPDEGRLGFFPASEVEDQ